MEESVSKSETHKTKWFQRKYPFWDSTPNTGEALLYGINDVPPWYLIVPLAIQQFLTMIGGTVLISLFILGTLCLENDLALKTEFLASIVFVMGITTFLQSTFGIRLPIIQGCSASLIIPIIEMMKLPTIPPCLPDASENATLTLNITETVQPPWQVRANLISGTILLSGAFQVCIGLSGVLSFLLRFIGPLVIAPSISLIGISLFQHASMKSEGHWWIAMMTTFLTILFTFYIDRLRLPFPWYSKARKCHAAWCAPFRIAPVMLAMATSWIVCVILTSTNTLPQESTEWGYAARTDTRISAISLAPWFHFPYPCQFGTPSISPTSVLAFFAIIVCSVVESVGDYHAAAHLCGAPEPPKFAINRAITIEGFGCFLSGLLGCPVTTTSYSENIGSIGMTRVGSRRVAQATAAVLLIMGIFPKLGALFISIPEPIIGGLFFVMFGVITGVGISNLQNVNLKLMRNLLVIGFSIFAGLMIPTWVTNNKSSISLGSSILSETVTILLTINMFVGGFIAALLDNTLPGSLKDRGLHEIKTEDTKSDLDECIMSTYELDMFRTYFQKHSLFSILPICPKYPPVDNTAENIEA